jgi:hypothetical protein
VLVGNRLVGLITDRASAWRGTKLTAQWLGPLLDIPDFVEKAGIEREDPLKVLLDDAARSLCESPTLAERIAIALGLASRDSKDLARALSRLTIVQLLTHANRLHASVLPEGARPSKEQRALAKSLEDLVDTLLPAALTSSGPIWTDGGPRSGESAAILVLPCKSMTVAEIFLANRGTRKSEYAPDSLAKPQPYGIRCLLPWTKVHAGFGETGDPALRIIFEHLAKELDVSEPFIPKGQLTPETTKEVDDVLRRRGEPDTRTDELGDYYFLFQEATQKQLAQDLKRLLPALHVCQLAANEPMAGESIVCDLLKDYLRRKQKRENHKK